MSTTNFTSSQSFGSVTPDDLEEIFQQIHDNVHLHPIMSNQKNALSDVIAQMDTLLPPTPPPDLLEKIAAIRNAQAPYYVVSGNPVARLIKRLHNLVLKVFGRKQAYYNALTLDLLESMVSYLHALQEHSKAQSSLIEALTQQVILQTEQLAARQAEGPEVETQGSQSGSRPGEGQ